MNKKYILALTLIVLASLMIYSQNLEHVNEYKFSTLTTAKGFSVNRLDFFYNEKNSVKALVDIRDPYPWGPFYPFVLSIFFIFFGAHAFIIHVLDATAFALFLIGTFLLFYILFKNEKLSILAALNSSILFFYMLFTEAGEQLEFFLFLMTFTLIFMFLSLKRNKITFYLLFAITFLFTIETRAEAAIILPAFFLGLFLYRFKEMRDPKNFWLKRIIPVIIIFIAFSPIFITHSASHYFYRGSESFSEQTFSIISLLFGSHVISEFGSDIQIFISSFSYFWTHGIFLFLTPFFIVGLFFVLKNQTRTGIILILIFILHTSIYFLWNNGYQMRYAFTTVTPYIIIVSFGMLSITKIGKKLENAWIPVILVLIMLSSVIYLGDNIANPNPWIIHNDLETGLEQLKNETIGINPNILIIGNEIFNKKVEFTFLLNSLSLPIYIHHNLLIRITPTENDTYTFNLQRGGFYFDPSIHTFKENLEQRSFELTTEFIKQNKTIQKKIKETILRNNTYIVEDKCDNSYKYIMSTEMFLQILDTQLLYEKDCVRVYKVIQN